MTIDNKLIDIKKGKTRVVDDNSKEKGLDKGAKILNEEEPDDKESYDEEPDYEKDKDPQKDDIEESLELTMSEIFAPYINPYVKPKKSNVILIKYLSENSDKINIILEKLLQEENAYHRFFREHMKSYGITKLGQMTKEKKSQFFKSLKSIWKSKKNL